MSIRPKSTDCAKLWLIGPLVAPSLASKVSQFSGPVILVDGAINAFEHKPKGALVVGDADSAHPQKKEWFDVLLPQEKDCSDLSHALQHHIPAEISHLECFGFSGGAFDHELVTMGEFSRFLQNRPQTLLFWEGRGWGLGKGVHQFTGSGIFTLCTLSPCEVLLTGNIRYPITSQAQLEPLSSWGLSNEGLGDFEVRGTGPLFILKGERP